MLPGIALALWIAALWLVPAASADDEKPDIAILRFGPIGAFALSERGTVDMLAAYGYINPAEREQLYQRQDLKGEKIDLRFGDASLDFANARSLADEAIEREVDVIVSISTAMTTAAIDAIGDMDDPPVLLFNMVSNPYHAGIARSPCLKPAYATGSQTHAPYDRIVPLIRLQSPNSQTIGVLYGANEANGVHGAETITDLATGLGLRVELAPVQAVEELSSATEDLVRRGVDAIILPTDATTTNGLSAILEVARKHDLLLLSSVVSHVYRGAPLAAGVPSFYEQGVVAGRMLVAWLEGELDVSTTRIHQQSGMSLAVNLDAAAQHNVTIKPQLIDMADIVVADGDIGDVEPELPEANYTLPQMSQDERRAMDAAFISSLHCADDMIADQQAQLDAAE